MPRLNDTFELTKDLAQRVLTAWLGRPVTCTQTERARVGLAYCVVRVRFDRSPFSAVIKLDVEDHAPGERPLHRELDRLTRVRALGDFKAPRVYWEDSTRTAFPFSALILEELPGTTLDGLDLRSTDRCGIDMELAEILLRLHSHTRDCFGAVDAPGTPSWSQVMLPRLLELRRDMTPLLADGVLRRIDGVLEPAPELLQNQGAPTLIHGDLWAGNILVQGPTDRWHISGIVDWPALQYADVESELAYLEVWNTVGPTFFERYYRARPVRPGYELRRLFYWLHTHMLHVWLEGPRPELRRDIEHTTRRLEAALAHTS